MSAYKKNIYDFLEQKKEFMNIIGGLQGKLK